MWRRKFQRTMFLTLILIPLFIIFYRLKFHRETLASDHNSPNCVWPFLDPWDRSISKFIYHPNSIYCPVSQPNMAVLDQNSNLYIALNSSNQCFYREISGALSPNSSTVVLGPRERILISPITVPLSQFEVTCYEEKSEKPFYRQPFMRIEPLVSKRFAKQQRLSVDVLVLDSVSLSQFQRHMVASGRYMREIMDFAVFEKPAKVGDNTLPNLITLFTGKRFAEPQHVVWDNSSSEFPRDRILSADSDFNFIWEKFSAAGCATMLHTDPVLKDFGFMFYPKGVLSGFSRPPTDYYFRPIHQYFINRPIENQKVKFCRGSVLYHNMVLNLLRQWHKIYRNVCHFSATLALHDYTHDNPSHLELLDAPLLEHLQHLHSSGDLNNTVYIIVGDHGNRISPIKLTPQGQIEERMSFFAVYAPPWFRTTYAEAWRNLQRNVNQAVVTHEDFAHTIQAILDGNFNVKIPPKKSGQSLFQLINIERDCETLKIPPQFCLCLVPSLEQINKDQATEKLKEMLQNYFVKLVGVEITSLTTFTTNRFVRNNVRHFDPNTVAELGLPQKPAKFYFLSAVAVVNMGSHKFEVIAQVLNTKSGRYRLTKVLFKRGTHLTPFFKHM